ncbi:MAG TPA: ABC transporter ATP-binding protein [Chthoniobacterales bacterium]|jgi:ABC-type Mn2+/Zn2+ transport system ATPase subunit
MANHRLEVSDLTVSYNRVPAVHHIGFETSCGQCVALMGPNGAGKTTLLKTLAGLLTPETGSIVFHGRQVTRANTDFAYLPQRENIDWDFPLTVRGLVEMGRYLRVGWSRNFRREDHAAVELAIEQMRLGDLEKRQISALSGGQQQRAFLARSLAQEAHVFLLDEPFAGLDEPARESLSATLRKLSASGKLIIASHHDLGSVKALFSEVLLLNGELIAKGPTREAFTKANIERTYSALAFSGKKH